MATARRAARAFSVPSPGGRRRRQPLHAPKGVVEGGQFIGRDALLHAVVRMLAGKPPAAGTPEHRAVSEHLAAKPRRRLLATARQRGLSPRRGKPDADVVAAIMRPAPKPVEGPRAPDNPDELHRLPVARLRAIAPQYGVPAARARAMGRWELLSTLRERANPAPAVDPDEARAQQLLGSWQTFGTLHGLDQLGILGRERPEVLQRIAQARGVQPDEGGNLVWPLSRDASLGRSGAIRAHGDVPAELAPTDTTPPAAAASTPRRATQRMAATTTQQHVAALDAMTSLEDAARYLAGVRGQQLTDLARHYNATFRPRADDRRHLIANASVGSRLAAANLARELSPGRHRVQVNQQEPPVNAPQLTGPAAPTAPDRITGRRPSAGLRISLALQKWSNGDGPDEPLVGAFTRDQLRREAVARGISLRRNATDRQIADALMAETRQHFRARQDSLGGLRSVQDLIDNPEEAHVRAVFEGNYGGLTTRVTDIYGRRGDRLQVEGHILDSRGNGVGNFQRLYTRNTAGDLVAHHEYLALTGQTQGSGFSNAWNGHLIRWYRQHGVKEVRVHADIDVGGYAWARLGYDFANESSASEIIRRLENKVNEIARSTDPARRLSHDAAGQIRAARELIARARLHRFGDARYPTPHEISQLGRWDGAGRMDRWIGKIALLNSDWHGVLRL